MRACFTIILSVMVYTLSGCSEPGRSDATPSKIDNNGTPTVYVSNYPLQYFTERIGAPIVTVHFPASVSDDPAYWKPTSDDIAAMQQADLIILNGALYETWLRKVSLPQSRLIDTSAGFKDKLIPLEKDLTHSHGLTGEHEHTGTAFTTWMDFTLAIEQAKTIRDALSKRWPEHQAQFQSQYTQLKEELLTLDQEFERIMTKAQDIPLIFSHPVYQYFERRYAVNGKSVHWEPDQQPDEAMLKELRELIGQHPAQWMIWEGAPTSQLIQALKAQGLESLVLSPCGNTPENSNFMGIMNANLEAMRQVMH